MLTLKPKAIIHEAGVYREAVVAAIIAGAIELANALLFTKHGESTAPGAALALAVAGVGLMLTVHRHSLQSHIANNLARIDRMADLIDIAVESDTAVLTGVFQAYARVTESEFREVKDQLLSNTIEQLRKLEIEKRSDTLGTLDYYEWLFRAFDNLGRDEYMHAVSLSSDTEWNDSELEKKFLQKNLDAAAAKAQVSRIFVVPPTRLEAFIDIPPIAAHCVENDNGLNGYYVDRSQLEASDAALLKAIGEGFIDFNGRVGLEDIFDLDGGVRGQVTLNPSDLTRMGRIYDRLQNMAVPLSHALVAPKRGVEVAQQSVGP